MALCWPMQMRPPAKAVLISLADMANDEGFCWPSLERISERTCFGRTAVIDAIAWLEERGVVRADRSNGRKTTYWVEPGSFTAEAVDIPSNQSATRTGTPDGPVRHADPTGTPGGLNRSATRTLTVKNRQEPKKTPQPPAEAGGASDATQMPATPQAVEDDGFDAFWRVYPRKKAEQRARRQWNRLRPNPALQLRIVAAIEAQRRSDEWQREGGRYVPLASAWLHGERWRDIVHADVAPEWWRSTEGVKAMGESLGMGFSLVALGNAFTDDQRGEHWRAYRAKVFEAAGSGPWSDRRAA